jgi:hypothetical protein
MCAASARTIDSFDSTAPRALVEGSTDVVATGELVT